MTGTLNKNTILTIFLIIANCALYPSLRGQDPLDDDQDVFEFDQKSIDYTQPIIKEIHITGNTIVPDAAIKAKLPRPGESFNKKDSSRIIHAIHRLGYFQTIQIVTEEAGPNEIILVVNIAEKPRISTITYEGNTVVAREKIDEKLQIKNIRSIDEQELQNLAEQIKKLYAEKNHHHVQIRSELVPAADNTFSARFIIDEGIRSCIKIVRFEGNCNISEKVLSTKVFTREDWLLGFFDRAGTYHPEAVLRDKYVLEDYYQSNGYLAARVVDTRVEEDNDGYMIVTFVIEEGDLYVVSKVEAEATEILTERQILNHIPIFPGQYYSKDMIRKTMEYLRRLWGEYGYIYADVQPSIRPDEKTKTVAITFKSDLGSCISVNRINIVGNRKTKDSVIRREILFNEGEILTTRLMEESKRRVELLGYFDGQDGVNWKIVKLDEDTADLDLILKEIKTGKIYAKMGFGAQADMKTPTDSFSVGAGLHDTNFMGSGIRYSVSGNYAANDKMFNTSIANNWLFNRPIYGGFDAYLRKTTYEDFKQTIQEPVEKLQGGGARIGFRLESYAFLQCGASIGCERISYATDNEARLLFPTEPDLQRALQQQINRTFQAGNVFYVGASTSQDMRNHPVFPTEGYTWMFDTKTGIPYQANGFGFFKMIIDAHWYTPIIQEYAVVLHLHGFFGFIKDLNGLNIPYRELFHIGGPSTVRGFNYGQIGPSMQGSSLGAKKAFTASAELQFPIAASGNMRGVIFYDGGSGWDTPDADQIPILFLQNNNFDFRHAIGFGFSLLQPTPMRIDWGFKLDRKKRRGESLSEVHINMSQDF